ncbi:MAG: ClpXP protease specificity-enhancing factor [Gallionella sp.]|nr:ClpXP protease specificity-enhancing factor [Gallionella sp.]MDD4945912.1 ClpXP protease specificity-enhancing factor [Gallionella sp.]MDD5611432.1 ClpXP protease specificity-enhancing factor [Gallionella sp.]
MSDLSTRPYLIRAIYEWCIDGAHTPYLAVRVNDKTEVPMAYVKDGEITLNLGPGAVRDLDMGNEFISCNGRFGGVPFQLFIPIEAVTGIFAKETGQGLVFQFVDTPPPDSEPRNSASAKTNTRPHLKVVK